MKAGVYCRVSTEKQETEGTSLQTQLEHCLKYCEGKGYDVQHRFSETYSGLTLDRPKLNELRKLVRDNSIDVIVVYCLDRITRNPNHGVILTEELEKYHVILEAVTETVDSTDLGRLISYIREYASKLEADKIKDRTKRGSRAKAEQGSMPCGFGRYHGYYGFKYDPTSKTFISQPSQIEIVKEILPRYANGESCTSIAKDLQKRKEQSLSGQIFSRMAVNRLLRNCEIYTGVIHWNEIKITGKIPAIINEEIASIIKERLKLNKEHAYGYGRRSWFSSRVFCGWCGRRYSITKCGCLCHGADVRCYERCESPKIGYRKLEKLLVKALLFAYSDEEAVIARAKEAHNKWEQDIEGINERKSRLEHELKLNDERRQRLSFQHEMGEISDDENASKWSIIKARHIEILNAISDTEKLISGKIAPADPEQVRAGFNWLKRLNEQEPLLMLLSDNPERHKLGDKLADILNFKATVLPDKKQPFKLEVSINLPLKPIKIEDNSYQAMLVSSVR